MKVLLINKVLTALSRHQTLFAFLAIFCLSVYALGANPFSGQTVAPLDLLVANPGWSLIDPDDVVSYQPTDILDSMLPLWITLKQEIRSGEGSLWHPHGAVGQPRDPFELQFLLFLSIEDNALALYLVGLTKLIIAGFGGYLLLRSFVGWLPSLWGGVVYMLCGFNAAWFFWSQVSTSMWVPWLLWATVMYLQSGERKWLPAVTLTSFFLILGSFPAVAAFGFYSFALLILVWTIYDYIGGNWPAAIRDAENIRRGITKMALPMLAVCLALIMAAVAFVSIIDSISTFDLSYRTREKIFGAYTTFAGTSFDGGIHDLLLFLFYEHPLRVERAAYVGIPVVLFAFMSIFSFIQSDKVDARKFLLFNGVLVSVSLLIAFGLLPHWLIRTIPAFGSNKWSRLIVITLLGLAVLSAFGMDYLLTKVSVLSGRIFQLSPATMRRVSLAIAIGILAYQFQSQKQLFNSMNAVVPSSWLYPLTPNIAYVKDHLAPLQSVIADSSYGMSGTLGAYGIKEWYTHSLKTETEKDILGRLVNDPFPSPTSALIDAANIHYDSALMDQLAIRYLLVSKDEIARKVIYEAPVLSRSLAPPLPDNSWRQRLDLPDDLVLGYVGMLFSTSGEGRAPANVRLTLYGDSDDRLIAESELNRNEIADNTAVYFTFPGNLLLRKGSYSFTLSLVDYDGAKKLTAWATADKEPSGSFLEINGVKSGSSLIWRVLGHQELDLAVFSKKWQAIDLEKDIIILENKRVTNSAYFIKSLEAAGDEIDFSGLDVKQRSSDRIEITYSGGTAGWLVLPIHLHPGWKASIGNRQVVYDAYLGMLPAIPVQQACKVILRYSPASYWRGLTVSLIGFLIFLGVTFLCLRKVEQE